MDRSVGSPTSPPKTRRPKPLPSVVALGQWWELLKEHPDLIADVRRAHETLVDHAAAELPEHFAAAIGRRHREIDDAGKHAPPTPEALPKVDLSREAIRACLQSGTTRASNFDGDGTSSDTQELAHVLNLWLNDAADWIRRRYPHILEPDYEENRKSTKVIRALPTVPERQQHEAFVSAVRLGVLSDSLPPMRPEWQPSGPSVEIFSDDAAPLWRSGPGSETKESDAVVEEYLLIQKLAVSHGVDAARDIVTGRKKTLRIVVYAHAGDDDRSLRDVFDVAVHEALDRGLIQLGVRAPHAPKNLRRKMDRYKQFAEWDREHQLPRGKGKYARFIDAMSRIDAGPDLIWHIDSMLHELADARRNLEPEDTPALVLTAANDAVSRDIPRVRQIDADKVAFREGPF